MKSGKLYGIGAGPGDPDLLTIKGARIISGCSDLFVPHGRSQADSIALNIIKDHVSPGTRMHSLIFPMITDRTALHEKWRESAEKVLEVLRDGRDACFVTLGDPLLYSTYIYLVRALREIEPGIEIVTVPGITSISAAAALTGFPVGEAKNPVTIMPTAEDLDATSRALDNGTTVALMKIGKRLGRILELIEKKGLMERSVLVSHAGLPEQEIVTDLRELSGESEIGYLSIILVHGDNDDE